MALTPELESLFQASRQIDASLKRERQNSAQLHAELTRLRERHAQDIAKAQQLIAQLRGRDAEMIKRLDPKITLTCNASQVINDPAQAERFFRAFDVLQRGGVVDREGFAVSDGAHGGVVAQKTHTHTHTHTNKTRQKMLRK